jgi:hypothetical protein
MPSAIKSENSVINVTKVKGGRRRQRMSQACFNGDDVGLLVNGAVSESFEKSYLLQIHPKAGLQR